MTWTILHGTDRIATADDYRVGSAGELYVYIAKSVHTVFAAGEWTSLTKE